MSLGDWYLNGTKLCPWSFSYDEGYRIVGDEKQLLDGTLRRDIVARKLVVNMGWNFLPEQFDGTYHCFADLKALGTKGTMTFIRPTGTGTGTTQYTVLTSMPQGNLAHRTDAVDAYWNVTFTVRQV
jgi:hypothetical protein